MDDSPTENPLCRQRGGSPCELTAGSDDPVKRDQPKITDFDNFLPWACRQYSVKKEVQVIRTNQGKLTICCDISMLPSSAALRVVGSVPAWNKNLHGLQVVVPGQAGSLWLCL